MRAEFNKDQVEAFVRAMTAGVKVYSVPGYKEIPIRKAEMTWRLETETVKEVDERRDPLRLLWEEYQIYRKHSKLHPAKLTYPYFADFGTWLRGTLSSGARAMADQSNSAYERPTGKES